MVLQDAAFVAKVRMFSLLICCLGGQGGQLCNSGVSDYVETLTIMKNVPS